MPVAPPADFLASLVGNPVKVTPTEGRKFIGKLTDVADHDDPVLFVTAGIVTRSIPWSAVQRLQVDHTIIRGEAR